ncbi:kinase-like domain-containing protein [Spinellus fusiger]|nr:kinase-like domain-containing protein [Spinellus fusiger]
MTAFSQAALSNGTMINQLKTIQVLGMGGYGQVYLAKHIDTHKLYAIKSLPQAGLDLRQKTFQRTEIGLHSRLSAHPHIIRLEHVIRQPGWIHVVMEYGPEGDLFSSIADSNTYYGNHNLIRKIFLQLLDAVSYCHDNHVYHRDLKPENILVFDSGNTIKLADFGLATTDPISKDYGCGSGFYFSPECQGDFEHPSHRVGYASAPNDIWSLGIVLINLAAGRNPWRQASLKDETFKAYLADPDLLLKILPISRELNQILKRILCVDPIRRIELEELRERILRCRFFTRTPDCERYEAHSRQKSRPLLVVKPLSPQATLPPSPPTTPRTHCPSTSWQKWSPPISPILSFQGHTAPSPMAKESLESMVCTPKNSDGPDSLLSSMCTLTV